MIQFYDYVRYYLWTGSYSEITNEYEALAIKLLDDCLDSDGETFADAVRLAVEIGGEDALVRFYDTVTTIRPYVAEVKAAALAYLHSGERERMAYYTHCLPYDCCDDMEMYRNIHNYEG